MADGDALHSTRTKAFSAVGIQKTLEKRPFNLFSSIFSIHPKKTLSFRLLKSTKPSTGK
jgi:hypothetical protein